MRIPPRWGRGRINARLVAVDVMGRETTLHDAVDVDARRDGHASPVPLPLRTTVLLYGHPVTITADAVTIHEPSPG
jgi:hypothetical protein